MDLKMEATEQGKIVDKAKFSGDFQIVCVFRISANSSRIYDHRRSPR